MHALSIGHTRPEEAGGAVGGLVVSAGETWDLAVEDAHPAVVGVVALLALSAGTSSTVEALLVGAALAFAAG